MKRTTLTANDKIQALERQVVALSTMTTRATLAMKLGQSFSGTRNLYDSLGYPTTIQFADYLARYTRQDIAKRIINAYPDACWSKEPEIEESEEEETEFEEAWEDLLIKVPIWHYLKRIDRISGIGRYGVLLIGFDDRNSLDKPVTKASKILYLRPFTEDTALIKTWVTDTKNERYGLPETYNLSITQPASTQGIELTTTQVTVHHSRVIHIADDLTSDDIYGTPRLEAVYNRLQDLEMIAGGGAEMWWRGAFPGFGFKAIDGATFDDSETPALESEIEDYIHGLKRFMKLKNIDIQQLQPMIADATKPFEVEITLISMATGIPKRILMGTERGELASSQDSSEWDDRTEERRANYCVPKIIRPFIDRLIMVGVLPQPTDGYSVYWSPVHVMNEKERAEIARTKTEAIIKYAGTMGADLVIPPETFLKDILGFDDDKVELIEAKNVVAREEAEKKKIEEQQMSHDREIALTQEQAKAKNMAGGNIPKTNAEEITALLQNSENEISSLKDKVQELPKMVLDAVGLIKMPEINIAPPAINITQPEIKIEPSDVHVHNAEQPINLTVDVKEGRKSSVRTGKAKRNDDGTISIEMTEEEQKNG